MHLHAFPYAVTARQRSFWPQGVYPPEGHPAGRPSRSTPQRGASPTTFPHVRENLSRLPCHSNDPINPAIIVAGEAYIEFTVTLRKTMKSRHQPTHKKRALAGQRERLAFLSAQNLLNPQRINSKAGCNRQEAGRPQSSAGLQKYDIELLLQCTHKTADRAMGHHKFFRRRRETLKATDSFEGP